MSPSLDYEPRVRFSLDVQIPNSEGVQANSINGCVLVSFDSRPPTIPIFSRIREAIPFSDKS